MTRPLNLAESAVDFNGAPLFRQRETVRARFFAEAAVIDARQVRLADEADLDDEIDEYDEDYDDEAEVAVADEPLPYTRDQLMLDVPANSWVVVSGYGEAKIVPDAEFRGKYVELVDLNNNGEMRTFVSGNAPFPAVRLAEDMLLPGTDGNVEAKAGSVVFVKDGRVTLAEAHEFARAERVIFKDGQAVGFIPQTHLSAQVDAIEQHGNAGALVAPHVADLRTIVAGLRTLQLSEATKWAQDILERRREERAAQAERDLQNIPENLRAAVAALPAPEGAEAERVAAEQQELADLIRQFLRPNATLDHAEMRLHWFGRQRALTKAQLREQAMEPWQPAEAPEQEPGQPPVAIPPAAVGTILIGAFNRNGGHGIPSYAMGPLKKSPVWADTVMAQAMTDLVANFTITPAKDVMVTGGPRGGQLGGFIDWVRQTGVRMDDGTPVKPEGLPGDFRTEYYLVAGCGALVVEHDHGQWVYAWPHRPALEAEVVAEAAEQAALPAPAPQVVLAIGANGRAARTDQDAALEF